MQHKAYSSNELQMNFINNKLESSIGHMKTADERQWTNEMQN